MAVLNAARKAAFANQTNQGGNMPDDIQPDSPWPKSAPSEEEQFHTFFHAVMLNIWNARNHLLLKEHAKTFLEVFTIMYHATPGSGGTTPDTVLSAHMDQIIDLLCGADVDDF